MKSYRFLYICLSLSLFLWLDIDAQCIDLQPGMTLAGRVTDGVSGVSDVVVSDGYTSTLTDANGVYQMIRNDSAKFVFVSVPNNYEMPTDGSLPAFYKKIDRKMKVAYANFQLTKTEVTNNFVLFAIADPQASKDWEMDRFRTETAVDINALSKQYPSDTNFAGIALGDLTWDSPNLYPSYKDVINLLPFAVLQVIGNHDHDETVIGNDYLASRNFERNFGPAYYSYNKGQCHFVVLDNMIYHDRKSYRNEITREQLGWLENDLKYVGKDKLIILGAHVPMQANKIIVSNAPDLYRVLEGYKVVMLSGHRHKSEYTKISDSIVAYNLGAAFGSGWVGDIGQDGAPNGYGVFEINGAQIKNQYFKATGKEISYQIKMYPLNSWDSKKDCVIANVWNWDENWKFDVYENGKLMKPTLTQYYDYDPYAYDYMFGPDKPKHRPKTEPYKTNHMFYYKPKNKRAEVRIVARDGFGNVYEAKIKADQRK